MFTDISGLFVINNESGWYEGWMIHGRDRARRGRGLGRTGHAQFGHPPPRPMRQSSHGSVTTTTSPARHSPPDGKDVHLPAATDHWPDRVSNTVPVQLSLGAYNATQQSDLHSYWELNQYTNWTPADLRTALHRGYPPAPSRTVRSVPDPRSFLDPAHRDQQTPPQTFGDNPNIPRDPGPAAQHQPG